METYTDWSDVPPIEEKEPELENLLAVEQIHQEKHSLFHSRLRKPMIWTAAAICIAWVTLLILVALTPGPHRRHHHHHHHHQHHQHDQWRPQNLSQYEPIVTEPKKLSWFHGFTKTPEKAVVLASYPDQDVTWLKNIPDDWTIFRYIIPESREPFTYLSFITENYHKLPDYTVFLHGHARAWHQIEPAAWKIRALNLTALDREGSINFRCQHDSGCTTDTLLGKDHEFPEFEPLLQLVGNMTGKFWDKMLKPYGFGDFPEEIGGPCCAQFAVTRSAIQTRSEHFYRNYMIPLGEENVPQGKLDFGPRWTVYNGGGIYEYLWHVVFGRPALHCPSVERCRKEFFSDAIACDSYPGRYQNSFGWEKMKCKNIWNKEQEEEARARLIEPDGYTNATAVEKEVYRKDVG